MSLIKQIKLENNLYDIGAKWSNIDKENNIYGLNKIITFEDDKVESLKKCIVNIEPFQAGSGDPSPTNVRAISGWTGAKVHATGKNLLEITATSTTISGVTFTVNRNTDGSVTSIVANGTATATIYFRLGRLDMRAGVTYALSGCPSGYTGSQVIIYVSSQPSSFGSFIDSGSGATKTLTQDYNGIIYYIRIWNGATVNNATFYPMVRDASTSATFEPLIGGTLEIAFPSEAGTVYGGTLDVLKGTLTVDRFVTILDGSETFYQAGNGTLYVATTADCPSSAERDVNVSKTICSCLIGQGTWTSFPTLTNSCLVYKLAGWPNSRICLNVSGITTKEDMATWCAQNTPTVSWLLATPKIYQLSPQIIFTLLGINNIWADCGNILIELENFYSDVQNEITINLNKNTLLYNKNYSLTTSNHYITNDKISINSLDHHDNYNLYVNGTSYLKDDTTIEGRIVMYGTGTNYTILCANPNGNHTCYLPKGAETMYLTYKPSIAAVGSSSAGVFIDANGKAIVTGSSDIRLKNIEGIIPDVSKISAIKFKWNESYINRDDKEHIGYSAQDVEEIVPFLVSEDENGYKILNYTEFLCAKIQCLEEKIKQLEEKIKQLEEKIKQLEEKIEN